MKYYGLFKNTLGEWITFAQGAHKADIYPLMEKLRKAGFTDDELKVVKAIDPETHIGFNHIELTMLDGSQRMFEIHSTNPRRDFLAYVQMAISGQLKEVAAIDLQDPCCKSISRWENTFATRPRPRDLSPNAVRELHAIEDNKRCRLNRIYA